MKALHYLAGLAAVIGAVSVDAPAADEGAASAMVKPDGTIVMTTQNYQRDWTMLGTFIHLGGSGAKQINVIYTQPETVTAYRESGEFPEGTVIIKELRDGVTTGEGDDMVSSLGELKGWFAMIKPPETNPPQGPLWGDGWGWAKFNADAPEATITTNYQTDCIGCHIPVQDTDFIHVEGYPLLRK
ncbi:cytochrome P460 family protein [Microbaculum marinum]|uniref:Cytochrome P460 family protein n=1 Tax=Microbaculum marinum TaxID=1764581 RepID=A0AAW9RSB4_9HYPH